MNFAVGYHELSPVFMERACHWSIENAGWNRCVRKHLKRLTRRQAAQDDLVVIAGQRRSRCRTNRLRADSGRETPPFQPGPFNWDALSVQNIQIARETTFPLTSFFDYICASEASWLSGNTFSMATIA